MSEQTHALTVGDRAHRVIARALDAGVPDSRSQLVLELTRYAREVFAEHPVEYRSREALVTATTAAGAYLHRFRPLSPWKMVGTELQVASCRFDVVHQHRGAGVLIDEIKLGNGRSDEAAVQEQIERYLEHGRSKWGSLFRGVRLCSVHEPMRSRLYLPNGRESLLLLESGLDAGVMVR